MSAVSSPRGLALVLVMLGSLVISVGSVLVFVTHEPLWRFLIVAGSVAQVAGWLRHRAYRRGGAA